MTTERLGRRQVGGGMIWLAAIVGIAATVSSPDCGDNTPGHTLIVFAPVGLIVAGIVLLLSEKPRKIGAWPLVIFLALFWFFVSLVGTVGACFN